MGFFAIYEFPVQTDRRGVLQDFNNMALDDIAGL
jgi:hypothetical protein